MAVLWKKETSHKTYEVRTAGASKRLYTNGVLHSQHNPNSLMTGSVWDLLTLGAFLVPEGKLKRVLVLGVGGGASMHQIRSLFAPDQIVGVELNPIHVVVAKKFFDLNDKPFSLVQADALKWIENYDGPSFDLIIDDMFGENLGEPFRVAKANKKWINQLESHLSPHGAIVLNFAEVNNFRTSAPVQSKMGFKSSYRLSTHNCENVVGIFGRCEVSTSQLRESIRRFPALDTRRASCKLKYNIRTVR